MNGMLVAHRPTGPLTEYVETLWYCEGYEATHARERVLPNGRFQLVIDLAPGDTDESPGVVIGIRSRYSEIETAALRSVIGVLFWPAGARAFFDLPAGEFYNRLVPLDAVWGAAGSALRERLQQESTPAGKFRALEIALRQQMSTRFELHPAVQYALAEFRRAPSTRRVLEVTKDAGLSRRRLSHLFRDQVGITPKLHCRLRRFQHVVQQVASGAAVNWADVALAGAYCDQSHMANEFREFAGMSPGAWLAGERPFLNHMRID